MSSPRNASSQAHGALAQHLVAGEVAVGVVVGLEVVDVDDRDAERRLGAAGAGHLPRQQFLQRAPVGQAGEGVVACQLLHLAEQLLAFALDLLQLGDVGRAGVDEPLVGGEGASWSAASASCRPLPGTRVSKLAEAPPANSPAASVSARSRSSGWVRSSRRHAPQLLGGVAEVPRPGAVRLAAIARRSSIVQSMSWESSKKRRARLSARAWRLTISAISSITTVSETSVKSQRVRGE